MTHPKKSHASPPTYNVKKGGYECLFTSRHFRLYLSDSSYVEVDAREDSPVSDAFLSTYQTQHYGQNGRFNTLLANQTDRPKLSIELFGRFTLVRVVLHGLRRSPVANGRFGGEAARSGGICHLLSEYTVARLSRSQS